VQHTTCEAPYVEWVSVSMLSVRELGGLEKGHVERAFAEGHEPKT
jgi:hypothetical protein